MADAFFTWGWGWHAPHGLLTHQGMRASLCAAFCWNFMVGGGLCGSCGGCAAQLFDTQLFLYNIVPLLPSLSGGAS